MTDINTIKNLRNNHGYSVDRIRKDLNINWRTAKKYADNDQLPSETSRVKKGMMYDEKWGDIVSSWLAEDARLTKKKRRTNIQFLKELKEIGFPGSYRTVCMFVQEWRVTHVEGGVDNGFERLEHPPADAQLDFGTMEVEHKGEFKDVKVLVMTFPYSNTGFAVSLPSENQECLLVGMKQLFKQAGGVPKNIRIDNMSTAVKKTKSKFEKAQLTDGFQQFANHYGFHTQVCNPRSGNEKGSVENKVGYVRYNFFPTAPRMIDYESLNRDLYIQLTKDRNRQHYEKTSLIEELWAEEIPALWALPEREYPVRRDLVVTTNKYNEITLDDTKIHISRARNHSLLTACLTWDKYQIVSGNGEIIAEGDRPYMGKSRKIPWEMIIKDWRRKLSTIHYSRYWKYLPGRIQHYLNTDDLRILYDRVSELSKLLVHNDMATINERFFEFIGAQSEDSDPYQVSWSAYDELTKGETK
ncbi:IS21 family transposase [Desemzia incerta]|uniref:IS21 family transposase n=1 Tax=Desemzia incerta TaxID=82801 RepID=UPI001CB6E9BC|nr:IS21 family transposase [Desemzia incerta]